MYFKAFFFSRIWGQTPFLLAFKWLFMVNAQAHKLFVMSFMGHAVTARSIVSFHSSEKNPETLAQQMSSGCLSAFFSWLQTYRLMSQISVWPSGKMKKHCLLLVSNSLHYCKKNSKLFHPVLCKWPFHPSLLPMDVLWAISSKLRRILDISSFPLCAAVKVPPLLCESKAFQRQHRAFWIISYSIRVSENTCFSLLYI